MKKEEKAQIDKEVFEIIEHKMRLMSVPFSMEMFKFGLEMFLEGVNFIPKKTQPLEAQKMSGSSTQR